MRYLRFLIPSLILPLTLTVSTAIAGGGHDHGQEEKESEHQDEAPRGTHGGRLFVKEDFAVEVTIYEAGVPPQFRVYAYQDSDPIKPETVKITIHTTRFGDLKQTFELSPQGEFLTSFQTVEEPHSFEVTVEAAYQGHQYSWKFDSYEGRTKLSTAAIKAAKIGIKTAEPRQIERWREVYGQLTPREDRVAHITPRFAGVIREIHKTLGDTIKRGDSLATIESNQSLQTYDVKSLISGMVVEQHAVLGEFVTDTAPIFVVADLSELWADFQIYRSDFEQTALGQRVRVLSGNREPIETTISYISPLTDQATQSKTIRALVPNGELKLRPGLFITGEILSDSLRAIVAVERTAVQTFRDWNVVFVTDGSEFQANPVELGAGDAKYVEILSGVSPGQQYVANNSFIIKADIEKSGAAHDH